MCKALLSGAGVVMTLVMFMPYIRSIRQSRTQPHVFSWLIWTLVTLSVFFAQLAGGAGGGAWPIGVSGLITAYVAMLAYSRNTDRNITRSDWIFLLVALTALPCWYFTSNPLWAVIILTGVDLAGFAPTFRTAHANPQREHIGFYALAAVRNLIAILALEHYSATTILFPAVVGFACVCFVAMVGYRRRASAELPARDPA